jgi:hypothetical protein
MDKDLQEYYEEQFSMMSSKGWTELMEDFKQLRESINNLSLTTDTQDLFFRKGQIDILDLILNRQKTCDEIYRQLQQES